MYEFEFVRYAFETWVRFFPYQVDSQGRVRLIDPFNRKREVDADPAQIHDVTNPYQGSSLLWWMRKRAYDETHRDYQSARHWQPPGFGLARLCDPPDGWTPPSDFCPRLHAEEQP